MLARLIVESGLATPRSVDLDPSSRLVLGRRRACGVLLQDRHASRNHAEVYQRDGEWYVLDCDTTNGTRLDGKRIQGEQRLHHDQVLAIGEVRLRFVLPQREMMRALEPGTDSALWPNEDTCQFEADELSELVAFMKSILGETSPRLVVERALAVIHRQSGADMVGYLSLDDAPELRLVLPEEAAVDSQLSERLTRRVQQLGQRVWLADGAEHRLESDSLALFHDAFCIPLQMPTGKASQEAPFGALHVYKATGIFNESQVRFAEAIAGSLIASLRLLREHRALEADVSRLRTHSRGVPDQLIGASGPMQQLREQIRRLADGPRTVLIFGESGVGKELVALGLHRASSRGRGPLVTVNCAAIVGSMAESELFGHVRGAFTGSVGDHPGFFAQADMGTLFLDELGELSLDLQAKLLRVIESRSFRPVGARADVQSDVRIVAATNRDLEREVREGRFRRDLFYRLTSRITVPPLRDHLEDLPELVEHFLAHLGQEYHRNVTLSEAAMDRLRAYSWPGNVRQLRSVLEAAVAMLENGAILHAGDLYLPPDHTPSCSELPLSLNLEVLEEWAIQQALARTDHNHTQAARLLGIHRDTLINKVKKYRISRET